MDICKEILNSFQVQGQIESCHRYGNGHINDTYLVATDKNKKYILQRVNHHVFKNVERLMQNQKLITIYIAEKLKRQGIYDDRLLLNIVHTKDGNCFLRYDNNYYRCYEFIEGGECLEKITDPLQFELSGVAFGRFQKLLNGFDTKLLFDTIPDFHNTRKRFNNLALAIEKDSAGRKKDCGNIIYEFLKREPYADKVLGLMACGKVPVRVTHNDTKLNNVLIDIKNSQPLAVLDLDTVMAGSALYDFGDSIRYGANKGAEDEKNLEKVGFDMELFQAFSRGFISQTKDILVEDEINNLAFGAILMTYECGMRFLTDYLEGDVYFKVQRPDHNLDRAKTQLKMLEDMEKVLNQMTDYVKELYE
ncbi:MAG: phosphotransferase enzyme family protein [Bacillota bacterium]